MRFEPIILAFQVLRNNMTGSTQGSAATGSVHGSALYKDGVDTHLYISKAPSFNRYLNLAQI